MKYENAKSIMEGLAWMSMALEKLAGHIAGEVKDEDERKVLTEHLKKLMHGSIDIQGHVLSQFPELDPIGKGEEDYFQAKLKYQAAGVPPKRFSDKSKKSAKAAGIQAASEIQSKEN